MLYPRVMQCEYGKNSSKRMSAVTSATVACWQRVGTLFCFDGEVVSSPGSVGGNPGKAAGNVVVAVLTTVLPAVDCASQAPPSLPASTILLLLALLLLLPPPPPLLALPLDTNVDTRASALAATRCGQSGGSHNVSSARDTYGNIPMLNICVVKA